MATHFTKFFFCALLQLVLLVLVFSMFCSFFYGFNRGLFFVCLFGRRALRLCDSAIWIERTSDFMLLLLVYYYYN